ncbi:MAG: hypothetical protein AB7J13_07125 [Pyrinomonadaceae bacterium]
MKRKAQLAFLAIALCSGALGQSGASSLRGNEARKVKGQPFERLTTKDSLGRAVTYYLSETLASDGSLPLVVFVQGSGCDSLFRLEGERIVPTGGFATFHDAFGRTARLMLVEKVGVKILESGSDGCVNKADFNRENTLDRRAESIRASILNAIDLGSVKASGVIVIGHSEGGLVSARVARMLPKEVSQIALLAAGGPTQLFDLISLARRGSFFSEVSSEPEQRVAHVVEEWKRILKDPGSETKFFFGFAYKRWSSFLRTSPIDELENFSGRIYIGQGVEDQAVDVASADALFADLVTKRKDVVYSRVAGADHSFRFGDVKRDGWGEQARAIREWHSASSIK